jgi:hypothetical protein
VEAEASRIRNYQLGFIPGLLQTEPYMRATFAGARDPFEGSKLEVEVQVRLRRQLRLVDAPRLDLCAVIDESVIRREPCDAARLRHLLAVGELPNINLQVLPQAMGSHDGLYSNFIIASFPDKAEPDLAYVPYGFGALQVEKEAEVRAANLTFDHLTDLALDEKDSRKLIARVIAEM